MWCDKREDIGRDDATAEQATLSCSNSPYILTALYSRKLELSKNSNKCDTNYDQLVRIKNISYYRFAIKEQIPSSVPISNAADRNHCIMQR